MAVLGRGSAQSLPRAEEPLPAPKTLEELCRFSVMPSDHLNYAVTWFTLSAATAVLAVKAARQAGRR